MKQLLIVCLVFPLLALSQDNLSISITGLKNSKGTVNVAAYNKSDGFLKVESVFKYKSVAANKGTTSLTMELPEGEYALAVFHDENDNGKLDTNFLGIPKEKIAFSKAKMKMFGPPDYKDCAFMVSTANEITILMN